MTLKSRSQDTPDLGYAELHLKTRVMHHENQCTQSFRRVLSQGDYFGKVQQLYRLIEVPDAKLGSPDP